MVPFLFESCKPAFLFAKEAFRWHGGKPFPDHLGQMFVTLGKSLFHVAAIHLALPVVPSLAVEE